MPGLSGTVAGRRGTSAFWARRVRGLARGQGTSRLSDQWPDSTPAPDQHVGHGPLPVAGVDLGCKGHHPASSNPVSAGAPSAPPHVLQRGQIETAIDSRQVLSYMITVVGARLSAMDARANGHGRPARVPSILLEGLRCYLLRAVQRGQGGRFLSTFDLTAAARQATS